MAKRQVKTPSAALRINPEGNLELLVQDDLTAATSLIAVLEGHTVIP